MLGPNGPLAEEREEKKERKKLFLFRAPCLSSTQFYPALRMRAFPAAHPR